MSIGIGDRAPAFTLPSTGGRQVSLGDFAGKPVVLVFYPGDETPVCTKQLNSYNNDLTEFEALDAGAEDVDADGDGFRVTCEPNIVYEVRDALEAAGLVVESAESTMVSSTTIDVSDADEARKVLRIVDALEDNDDVQDVYGNFDISDELMETVS